MDVGINWEFGVDMFTLLYMKQMIDGDLLYRTKNSTQYSEITLWRKKLNNNIYICITESLCCTPETNITL